MRTQPVSNTRHQRLFCTHQRTSCTYTCPSTRMCTYTSKQATGAPMIWHTRCPPERGVSQERGCLLPALNCVSPDSEISNSQVEPQSPPICASEPMLSVDRAGILLILNLYELVHCGANSTRLSMLTYTQWFAQRNQLPQQAQCLYYSICMKEHT